MMEGTMRSISRHNAPRAAKFTNAQWHFAASIIVLAMAAVAIVYGIATAPVPGV